MKVGVAEAVVEFRPVVITLESPAELALFLSAFWRRVPREIIEEARGSVTVPGRFGQGVLGEAAGLRDPWFALKGAVFEQGAALRDRPEGGA